MDEEEEEDAWCGSGKCSPREMLGGVGSGVASLDDGDDALLIALDDDERRLLLLLLLLLALKRSEWKRSATSHDDPRMPLSTCMLLNEKGERQKVGAVYSSPYEA